MQFLMGLSGEFVGVRHQLLVMDPKPSINKAYSMVQSVEKHKEVHMERSDVVETTMHVKAGFKHDLRKRNMIDKRAQYCRHCEKTWHTKETCFKLHGTPDWYKDLIEKKKRETTPTRGYAAGVGR
ncbi:UNVERIFIED_CONTAM: hypothetical protein Sradi_6124700 [Sesamum radiatum]|uniref:Uncharacterized protein n=1 Tax=Sesamum radiatum TaxID=300843 RepID=A0AAW2KL77_SESRA